MKAPTKDNQAALLEVSDLVGVRFERLTVLADTLNDIADDYQQECVALYSNDYLASRLQSAAGFLMRELKDAEEEFNQAVSGGES